MRARRALDTNVEQRRGERRVELRVVAVTRDDQALGAEVALERVADRVERGVVGARDDERRERRARASRSSGISASQGPRSAISARAPRSSAGGSGEGGSKPEPTAARKPRRNASGSSRGPSRQKLAPPRANAATAGSSSATLVQGGSITVSDAEALADRGGGEERDHAPVGVADQVVARLRRVRATQAACSSKSTRGTRPAGTGGESRPLQHDELGFGAHRAPLLAPRAAAADDAAVDEDEACIAATNVALFRSERGKGLLQAR